MYFRLEILVLMLVLLFFDFRVLVKLFNFLNLSFIFYRVVVSRNYIGSYIERCLLKVYIERKREIFIVIKLK